MKTTIIIFYLKSRGGMCHSRNFTDNNSLSYSRRENKKEHSPSRHSQMSVRIFG